MARTPSAARRTKPSRGTKRGDAALALPLLGERRAEIREWVVRRAVAVTHNGNAL